MKGKDSTLLPPRLMTVAVSGFSSRVGKTTLVCELLRAFPGWEAIKLSRRHLRSDARHLLIQRPDPLPDDALLVCSGREGNYAAGKDTARFWDAGAANVHWVIASHDQVEEGVSQALARVRAPGVIIEGNSFLRFMDVDFAVMVARAECGEIKPTAGLALRQADALFISGNLEGPAARDRVFSWRTNMIIDAALSELPVYGRTEVPSLIARIRERLGESGGHKFRNTERHK